MTKKAIIIGSGIAGLALSVRLRLKKYEVHVFEKNDKFGGKLEEFRLGDYRYDFGPKLFTMPDYLVELFTISNKDVEDYIKYEKLDISCKYFWEDGTCINGYSNRKKLINEFSSKLSIDKKKLKKYFKSSENKFRITQKIFIDKSLHKFSTFFSLDTIIGFMNIFNLDIFKTLNNLNQKTFKNKKAIQFFNRFATYNGSNPYETSGIMSMIHHLEHDIGAYMPRKGMNEIPKSVFNLALDLGVKFHFNSNVDEIIVKEKSAKGIKIGLESHYANIVISNMDVNYTYEKLLRNIEKPAYLKNYEPSSSAVVFYWNINKSFKKLDLHNVIFSDDYLNEFNYIFNKKSISDDPTVYICSTSKIIKSDAPPGCENWFILINSPHDIGQDWEIIIDKLRKNIIKKINSLLNIDISKFILMEKILTPKDIDIKTLSKFGSLYGSSSNSLYSAFLRHPNFSKRVNKLYFCGGSVHPGGGIPLCLKSAKIVSDLIK